MLLVELKHQSLLAAPEHTTNFATVPLLAMLAQVFPATIGASPPTDVMRAIVHYIEYV